MELGPGAASRPELQARATANDIRMGNTLIIELSTVGEVDGGGHYHSIYRDPTNEYGSRGANRN